VIDIVKHRQILLNILKDIYQDSQIAPLLGFKGGTCLYFFHELPRFSTDLDFNLVNADSFQPQKLAAIFERYVTITDFMEKRNTWFWLGSYKKTHHGVKIEISKRLFDDEYEQLNLYGISVRCLKKAFLFAHKLCAIKDRTFLANRDLFDAHFMFQKQFPVAEQIIEKRTGLKTARYFQDLADYIPKHISQRGILDGLAEMLDQEQKQWVKTQLISSLLFYLRSYRGDGD
jgi:predicted nucleotidyltransferase component of viral defense system